MNEKFPIKTVALMLLEKIYLESNYDFRATINVNDIINEKINMNLIQQSAKYLKEKIIFSMMWLHMINGLLQ